MIQNTEQKNVIIWAECKNGLYVCIHGQLTVARYGGFLNQINELIKTHSASVLYLDLSNCSYLDSTCMGNMVQINSILKDGLVLYNPHSDALEALSIMGLLDLLNLSQEKPELSSSTQELGQHEFATSSTVLMAHKKLMEISPDNILRFQNLVAILEQQKPI
jgi:anti-anti-sigma regulatory factor